MCLLLINKRNVKKVKKQILSKTVYPLQVRVYWNYFVMSGEKAL